MAGSAAGHLLALLLCLVAGPGGAPGPVPPAAIEVFVTEAAGSGPGMHAPGKAPRQRAGAARGGPVKSDAAIPGAGLIAPAPPGSSRDGRRPAGDAALSEAGKFAEAPPSPAVAPPPPADAEAKATPGPVTSPDGSGPADPDRARHGGNPAREPVPAGESGAGASRGSTDRPDAGIRGSPAAGAAEGGAPGIGGAVPGGLGDADDSAAGERAGFRGGAARVREAIQARIVYPEEARRLGLEGEVLLRIRIERGGHPGAIRVARSSGARILDEAARRGVVSAAPLPSAPGWVEIPVRFFLK